MECSPNSSYAHDYFVDGGITVAKVKKSDGSYATMAVGALGQGGQGVYALDLSNLSSVSQDLATASRLIKWEFTDSNDADLATSWHTGHRPAQGMAPGLRSSVTVITTRKQTAISAAVATASSISSTCLTEP